MPSPQDPTSRPDALPAEPGDRALRIGQRELVAMLAFCSALQALAIDAMLPALGDISRELAASDPNRRQLVVGLFLLGIALGSLAPGPLADRFGRKPVILWCIAGFVVTSLAGALVADFTLLAILRFVSGFLCAGLAVVPSAILRDRFEGDRMASLQSTMAVIFMVVPMIAPTLGQGVLMVAGWRWIFGLLGGLGVVMGIWVAIRLPETLKPEFRQPIHLRTIGGNFSLVIRTRGAIGYVLASTCTLGIMWGYIQSCQQLLGEHFGAGEAFPLFFGGMALAMAMANLVNSRLVERFGARRMGHGALCAYLLIALAQVWLAHGAHQTLWQFVIVMTLTMICSGFTGANFASIAIQPFAHIAGSASAVNTTIRNTVASMIGAAVGQSYDGSARPLSIAMVMAGVVALSLVLWSEKGRLFRRVLPPGSPRPL